MNKVIPGRAYSPNAPIPGGACSPNAPMVGDGGFGETALPVRKKLSHEIPSWVEDGEVYFITINCVPRGHNQLTHPHIAEAIGKSILFYQGASKWWIHLFLLMPDHLHGLISFGSNGSMSRIVTNWKRYLATQCGIQWQRDFFDHRIRNSASLTEKWDYIRNNPVRAGLAQTPEDWPYQWNLW